MLIKKPFKKALGTTAAMIGSGIIGPPTFNYQGIIINQAPSVNTITFNSVPIGTASATRFVSILVLEYTTGGTNVSSATINGSATGVTITSIGANAELSLDLITATVTTGTTLNLVVTFPVSPAGSINYAAAYTSDTTTMLSTTPINYGLTQTTSVTSMTKTFNVTGSGTALIAGFGGFGITNGTQAFTTPNDPPVLADATQNSDMVGHANNFGPNASTRVSVNWTTTFDGNLGVAGFR